MLLLWSLAAAKAALSTTLQCVETCCWRWHSGLDLCVIHPSRVTQVAERRFVFRRVYSDEFEMMHLLREAGPVSIKLPRPGQVMALSGSACSMSTTTTKIRGLRTVQTKRVLKRNTLSGHKTSFGNLTRRAKVVASLRESPGLHKTHRHPL